MDEASGVIRVRQRLSPRGDSADSLYVSSPRRRVAITRSNTLPRVTRTSTSTGLPADPAVGAVLAGRCESDLDAARAYAQRFTPARIAARYASVYRALVADSQAVRPAA